MPSHVFPEDGCPLHHPQHEINVVSQWSLPIEGIPILVESLLEVIVIEWAFDKEEVIHDKGIDLGQLIDASVEEVDAEPRLDADVVDQPMHVDQDVHRDVDRVPRLVKGLHEDGDEVQAETVAVLCMAVVDFSCYTWE